ncbi:MAG TPA: PhoH family protein [Algoriphagus sp.]|jgi:PhoH-like ATPase|uniref:PhoH-like ATPase n=1 Tax=Algoriphagus ornithinivorans TaxID=226506 RepID=A0A1I5E3T0_9BACT|nr:MULTISPECIES: PhoH family protein [Algoriphagus]MAL15805.1 ribonuclease [Algoriphagus sp.]MAN86452.1 ribonuclease [Algoriphagus sp.]QYH40776.1 PhoH family protein [Algoriphagus sp. NBT04N3]SFO05983.1 PhoH-like ATPase [Algoriphagus ornithinivorans]HAD51189.1 PhoH family protein [Algoriphagus sp.]|tara:strand:+ start:5375 stop:6721 length:1347 start_codon:yes stop_codon:yes gene_type:complete
MPRAKAEKERKIFVLDTSVILYAHNSIMNFAEHDVVIPITVLEELDQFKKGNDTKNFEAREFIRLLDKLSQDHMIHEWTPLNGKTKGNFRVLMNPENKLNANVIFGEEKNDHKILNAALYLKEHEKNRKVILVSKDINLRLKAKSLEIHAEDYETGKIKNINELENTGKYMLDDVDPAAINKLYESGYIDAKTVLGTRKRKANAYYILRSDKNSVLAYYNPEENILERVDKKLAYNIKPKNAEQTFALDAITNPNIRLVSIQGVAGTGKTLLALAGALEQRRDYKQIFLARPIVPLSNKDIGYLPGDIKSKLNPYMEPLWDNLKFIQNQYKETDKEFQKITELVNQEKLVIQPLAYIRGRSLSNIFFIVDEAQNLTPHEIKTIISRAGENTKIVFTGDVHQIDTPYLDSQSNGLSYLIDRVKDHPLYAHIKLEKGERSELANLANELL